MTTTIHLGPNHVHEVHDKKHNAADEIDHNAVVGINNHLVLRVVLVTASCPTAAIILTIAFSFILLML